MSNEAADDVTQVLGRIRSGDDHAKSQLIELAYNELRDLAAALMSRERTDHTLQPTALVHEAAMRLLGTESLENITNRRHFFGAMAEAMRRVLVDHARRRNRRRREGSARRIPLDDFVDSVERDHQVNLIALDEALVKLAKTGGRECDVVVLRFFGGMELAEIARQLDVSLATVKRDWQFARAWLRQTLQAGED